MKLHGNARLSVKGRELLIARILVAGWSLSAAAEAAGISDRTARKWLARYRAEGPSGLLDRSSAPAVVANRTDERRIEAIAAPSSSARSPAPSASPHRPGSPARRASHRSPPARETPSASGSTGAETARSTRRCTA
jgi:transposase IS481 family protein